MPLCGDCRGFDLHSFAADPCGLRGYAYATVRERSHACDFCRLLESCFDVDTAGSKWVHMQLLTTGQRPIPKDQWPLNVVYLRVYLAERRRFTFGKPEWPEPSGLHPTGQESVLHISANEGSLAAQSGEVLGRFHGKDLLSLDNHVVDQWLKECLKHDACQRRVSGTILSDPYSARLPSRCIDVGTSEDPVLRLKACKHARGAYVALSHRWTPSTQVCCTDSINIGERLAHLDPSGLPKSFQASIEMTRRIRVRYLWIDSICIIQSGDNGHDWKTESQRLADYFSNALVTFAATTEQGLVPEQVIISDNGVKMSYRARESGVEAGKIFIHRSSYINHQYQSQIQDSELLSRGWVYQEYLLSQRLIWFAPKAVFFECRSRSPINEHGESLAQWRKDGTAETLALVHKKHFTLESGDIENLTMKWYDIIETYSALRFTFPLKDRFIALAGFAQEFGQALGASCMRENETKLGFNIWKQIPGKRPFIHVSGLWMYRAHIDLLWEQANPGPHERLSGYPSWSWASIYSGVLWINRDIHRHKLLSHERPVFMSRKWGLPEYSDFVIHQATAEYHNPTITMTTKLQVVTIDRLLQAWELEHLYLEEYRPRAVDNLVHAVRSMRPGSRLCGWASLERSRSSTTHGHVEEHDGDDGITNAEGGILAMLISTTDRIGDDFRGYYSYPWHKASNVLFIRPVGQQTYERVGVGVLFGKDVDRDWAGTEKQVVTLV